MLMHWKIILRNELPSLPPYLSHFLHHVILENKLSDLETEQRSGSSPNPLQSVGFSLVEPQITTESIISHCISNSQTSHVRKSSAETVPANHDVWNRVTDFRKARDTTKMFLFQTPDNPNH